MADAHFALPILLIYVLRSYYSNQYKIKFKSKLMSQNPSHDVFKFGQSVWYDNISRDLLLKGEITKLVSDWGVRGMTSNPSIFDSALKTGIAYDGQVASLRDSGLSVEGVFDELALVDIALAADILLPIYKESGGEDGFVSLEVSPLLARDSKETVKQAKRLNARLNRPNVMIKIPGTKECMPAIRECLEDGISINVTLLFSVDNYIEVAKTYIEALNNRIAKGLAVDKIRSVASFFVSRVDTIVDSALDKVGTPEATELKGEFGIANCRLAYEQYKKIFNSPEFQNIKSKGGAVQRPLWASTSVKNPKYKDTLYVEELVGPDTVNTMPHQTLAALVDHGEVMSAKIEDRLKEAHDVKNNIESLGISTSALMDELQEDGVKKFADSFASLIGAVESKIASV